jgi:hypothetical protein
MDKINRTLEFGLDSSASAWVPVAGYCEHGNETSGSFRNCIFFQQLLASEEGLCL